MIAHETRENTIPTVPKAYPKPLPMPNSTPADLYSTYLINSFVTSAIQDEVPYIKVKNTIAAKYSHLNVWMITNHGRNCGGVKSSKSTSCCSISNISTLSFLCFNF